MDISPNTPSKRTVSVKCFRYTLDAINVLQVIIACLMIIGAIAIKSIFREYHFTSWYSALNNLPNLWIAVGCFLAVFSVFGVFATIRDSTNLINLYAISIIFVFILQMAAAISGFILLPKSGSMVRSSLTSMMEGYEVNQRYRTTMDWIQETYQCCGNLGPSDWEELLPNLPHSCCSFDSCDSSNKHDQGCHSFLYDRVFHNILLIASSSLVIGLLQIGSITCAIVLAASVRQSKTERDIQKWTVSPTIEKNEASETPEVEQREQREQRDGDINYI